MIIKKLFTNRLLFFLIVFPLLSGCVKKEAEKEEDSMTPPPPTPKIIKPTNPGEPENDFVKVQIQSHEGSCGKYNLAGGQIYNASYELMQWISKLRGLEFKKIPPLCVLSPEEFKDRWNSEYVIKTKASEKLSNNDLLLALGIRKNFPEGLQQKTAGEISYPPAYYTTDEDKAVYMNKEIVFDKKNYHILVHELTHALQDQNYDLAMIGGHAIPAITYDESRARLAVIEGDAKLVDMNYIYMRAEKEFPENSSFIDNFKDYIESELNAKVEGEENKASKPYLFKIGQEYFTYYLSIPFLKQNVTDNKDLSPINEILENPPTSSEEVLHPDKYRSPEPGYEFSEELIKGITQYFASKQYMSPLSRYITLGEAGLSNILAVHEVEVLEPESAEGDYGFINHDLNPFDNATGWMSDISLVFSKTLNHEDFDWRDSVAVQISKWDDTDFAYRYFERLDRMINVKYRGITPLNSDSGNIRLYSVDFERLDSPRLIYLENFEDTVILVERFRQEDEKKILGELFSGLFTNSAAAYGYTN
jgi:hypothetical protein